uniref:Fibrobacter succinogenes major paralogous domain-containing protein n=1 Tax=viral metagenome TaxID=1070528 RepID=A0A6M3JET0_9ZZZZ
MIMKTITVLLAVICLSCTKEVYIEVPRDVIINDTVIVHDTIKLIVTGTYTEVIIGNQVWLKENLRENYLNDSTEIPIITNPSQWSKTTTPACCFYNNDPEIEKDYGLLYNWYAVNTGKLCPVGYHVPSDDEWKELERFIGTEDVDGIQDRGRVAYKLKAKGEWDEGETDDFNITGFSAVPSKYRYNNGYFHVFYMDEAAFWTTGEFEGYRCYRALMADRDGIHRSGTYKESGMSVRCIKNR